MTDKDHITFLIKQEAKRLGFDFCGISRATFLSEEAPRLENWLKTGKQGEMAYMENYFDKRLDPRLLVDNAKSVISVMLNYFPSEKQNEEAPKISKYAYGTDYHFVLKEKLSQLADFIKKNVGDVNGRAFVDSAPVMDKAWAKKSGLGWMGKNSNIINKNSGSFFFIGELILDIELSYDGPVKDYCGTCTRCIDACPTGAIVEPYVVDGSKCISYFTIELKGTIPESVEGKFGDWVFGCDVCQDVCPWNRFSKPHNEPLLRANSELLTMNRNDWYEITEEVFGSLFKKMAVKRTKFNGLKRNLQFIKSRP